jgi:hypothetical protein
LLKIRVSVRLLLVRKFDFNHDYRERYPATRYARMRHRENQLTLCNSTFVGYEAPETFHFAIPFREAGDSDGVNYVSVPLDLSPPPIARACFSTQGWNVQIKSLTVLFTFNSRGATICTLEVGTQAYMLKKRSTCTP